ncbi:hypothetical protein [Pedobacter sp. SL55]|uniref:hypothetical protein n=1 Tax=Pedobacter sp. SL55 TaxID=2995161 RepID=UPI00226F613C|nr:hypothetical protein [Pedobacter sp. SL55]WAC40792.1 hypothetical protein OVA16_19850 [Pedobacter sp. SL55]
MDKNICNKLSNIHDFLLKNKNFCGDYIIYEKIMLRNRKITVDFLKQFKEIKVKFFFNESYLKKNDLYGVYFNSDAVVDTKTALKIHTEFRRVILRFWLYKLKDVVRDFLNLLKSEEFRKNCYGYYKNDGDNIKLIDNERFWKFISQKVLYAELVFDFLYAASFLIKDFDFFNQQVTTKLIIKLGELDRLFKENEEVYNFEFLRVS